MQETLFVISTNRGRHVVEDQVDAILWSCEGRPCHIIIVDDDNTIDVGDHGHFTVIKSQTFKNKNMSGFKNNEGIQFALNQDIPFGQIILMDDDSLLIGKGLDIWAVDQIHRQRVDLVGTQDRVNYQDCWPHWRSLYIEWGCEKAEAWLPGAGSVFYATCAMSRRIAETMMTHNMLIPEGHKRWGLWPDTYISWTVQLLGGYMAFCGHMDKPKAPLYMNHTGCMRWAPDPRILRSDFLVYHPLRSVSMASEEELRLFYSRFRRDQVDPRQWPD